MTQPPDPGSVVAGRQRQLLLRDLQGPLVKSYFSAPLVHHQFAAAAATHPSRPCVLEPSGRSLSYAEVHAAVCQLAAALGALRLPAGAPVALLLERSAEWVVAMLASLASGHPFVPMEPSVPQGRAVWYLQDARPALVLCAAGAESLQRAQQLLGAAGDAGDQVPIMQVGCGTGSAGELQLQMECSQLGGQEEQGSLAGKDDTWITDPSVPAYILFTSGSTGRPKGAMVTHMGLRDLVMFFRDSQIGYDVNPADISLAANATTFDMCIGQVLAPAAAGAATLLVPPHMHTNFPYLADLILQHGITFWFVTPAVMREVLRELKARSETAAVRIVLVGGEQWTVEQAAVAFQTLPKMKRVVNFYGPTECTVGTVCGDVPKGATRMYVGRPDANVHAYVVDEHMQLVAPGAPGELLLSGPRLAAGYLGRDDLTAAKFVPNPFWEEVKPNLPESLWEQYRLVYRTGDLVAWKQDGRRGYQMEVLGRIDRQLKINGVRMEQAEVEAVLEEAPGVTGSAVMVRKAPTGRDVLVAYVTPAGVGVAAVLQFCRGHLLPAMVPSIVMPLPEFPLSPSGKVDTEALPDPYAGATQQRAAGAAPASKAEERLQKIWTECLGLQQPMGVMDDYFAMGGSSLQLFRVMARMEEDLGLPSLPPTLVYTTRTIRATAEALAALEGASQPGGAVVAEVWSGPERPVSSNQQQMWMLWEAGLGAAYNMQMAMSLRGALNVEALRAALQSVVDRHELLRTRLYTKADGSLAGEVFQPGTLPVPFRVTDCGKSSEELAAILAQENAVRFDLGCPPLLHALLLRHGPEDYTLAVTMHHSVGDAWSFGVLFDEASAAYNAAVGAACSAGGGGKPPLAAVPPPPLPLQYADYALWQQRMLEDQEEVKRLQQYWRQYLAGCVPVLQLPYDHPRPPSPTQVAGRLCQFLGKDLAEGMARLASNLQVSLQAVQLAAVQLVLLRYSNQEEVTIGVPTAGRQHRETHPLIGFFINSLPIRAVPKEGATFADLATQAAHALRDTLAHSALPLQQVVESAGVPRQPGVNPLFQVMFQAFGEGEFTPLLYLSGVQAAPLPQEVVAEPSEAKIDLYIQFDAEGNMVLEYMTELFERGTIEGLAESLRLVLSAAVSQPNSLAAGLPMLGEEGAADLLARFACRKLQPGHPAPPLAHQLFEQAAAENPAAACLLYEEQTLTYRLVNRKANQLAQALLANGIQPDMPVGLLIDRSPTYVIAALATLKAGGCFLPLDPTNPKDRLAACVEDASPAVVLTQTRHKELASSLSHEAKVLMVDDLLDDSQGDVTGRQPGNPPFTVSPSNLAYILFTSGSTGRPKGAMITHRGLADFVKGAADTYDLRRSDIGMLCTSCTFDAHICQVFYPLTTGGALAIATPEGHVNPQYMAGLIRSARVSILISVPSLVLLYLDELRSKPCDTLHTIISGGEALPRRLLKVVEECFPHARVFNGYGPTEATVETTCAHVSSETEVITVGYPESNVHCYIAQPLAPWEGDEPASAPLDPILAPLGMPGELVLSGPRLGLGYVKRPELTERAFVPNPWAKQVQGSLPEAMRPFFRSVYRTGDLARWRFDGTIEYLGRIDQQIKIDGVRMESMEIEAVLAAAPGVAQVAVAAQPVPPSMHKRLVAYVMPASVDVAAVKEYCRSKLSSTMVPTIFVPLDSLPLLPSGKVNRKALPPPAELGEAAEDDYVAPVDEVEEVVQEVMMEVLGLTNPLSVTADFFASGGSSLKAGVIQARLRERLNTPHLAGNALMQHPSIRALAAEIMRSRAESAGKGITPEALQRFMEMRGSTIDYRKRPTTNHFCHQCLQTHLSAEDPKLPTYFGEGPGPDGRSAGLKVPPRVLPYPVYLVLQYLLLVVANTPSMLSWSCMLLALTLAHRDLGTAWLVLLWIPIFSINLLAIGTIMVLYTWMLLPRGLTPGVYPLYGWLHCRWAAARAIQRMALSQAQLLPFVARTPVLTWLYRLLGARIGRGVILDSGLLQEPQLLRIGEESRVGFMVTSMGAMIVPAGIADKDEPALVFSQVCVGDGCAVGHKAVLPAGGRLRDGFSLMPRAAPSQRKMVKKGPLDDTPEFCADEKLGPVLSMLSGMVAFVMHAASLLPGLAAVFAIMGVALSGNPFDLLDTLIFNSVINSGSVQWKLIAWPALFTALFQIVALPLGAFIHCVLLVTFKRLVLGSIPPGTCLTTSPWLLFRYAVYLRMLEDAFQDRFKKLVSSTTLIGDLYRLLGAQVGKDVFLGDFNTTCHDALVIGDCVATGCSNRAYGVDADGVVRRVVMEDRVTVGNSTVMYPGSHLEQDSLLGNDSVLKGERLEKYMRKQGSVRYSLMAAVPHASKGGVNAGASANGTAGSRAPGLGDIEEGRVVDFVEGSESEAEPAPSGAAEDRSSAGGGRNGSDAGGAQASSAAVSSGSGVVVQGRSSAAKRLLAMLPGQGATWRPAEAPSALPRWHSARILVSMLLVLPIAPILRWTVLAFVIMLVASVAGWAAIAVYVAGLGMGIALATLWLRLLPSLIGMYPYWHKGSAQVTSITAAVANNNLLNPALYDILLDTPFMASVWRALGLKLGKGVLVTGYQAVEIPHVSIGDGAIVEGSAFVEGHFIENMRFNYKTCSVGARAWVQQGARVMPGVTMGAGARLLPGSTVLPGEVLGEGTLWGGGVPANPRGRVHPSMHSPGASGSRSQWKDEGTDAEDDQEDESSEQSSEEKGWFPVSIALFK